MGTINGSTSNVDIVAKIEYFSTESISDNTSSVTAKLYLRRTDSLQTYGYGSFSVKINGTSKGASSYVTIGSSWTLVCSGTTTVPHNDDGSKTITISSSGSIPGTTLSSINCSGSVTLPTIARASKPTAADVAFGGTVTIKTNRKSSTFTHTIDVIVGSHTTRKTGIATSVNVEIPTTWADAAPNSSSVKMTIKCTTYSGSTKIGEATADYKATVPASWMPTIGDVSATGVNLFNGLYLTFLSSATINATGCNASYASSIKSYEFAGPALTKTVTTAATSSSATSGPLPTSGDLKYTVKLTDTRGRTATETVSIAVVAYSAPTITLSADRYNDLGNPDVVGPFFKAEISGNITPIDGNSYTVSCDYRQHGAKDDDGNLYDWIPLQTWNLSTEYYDVLSNLTASSDVLSWDIRATITDLCGSTITIEQILPVGTPTLDLLKGGKGIAMFTTAEEDGLKIAGDVFTNILKHLDGTDWMDDAIIECDIPNSSTEWKIIKTEKGLAICWQKIYGAASITNTWGSIYTNGTKPYAVFPFSFIAEPTVFMSPSSVTGLNGDYWLGKVNMAQTASRSGDIGLWRPTSATGVNYGIYVLAIGRYK